MKKVKLPGIRTTNRMLRHVSRESALRECLRHDRKAIYSGLLHLTRELGWKDRAAWHAFKEVYGVEPRPQDKGPPTTPPDALRTWFSLRPKWKRSNSKKGLSNDHTK